MSLKLYTTTDDGQVMIPDVLLRMRAVGANLARMGRQREAVAKYAEHHLGWQQLLQAVGLTESAPATLLWGFDHANEIARPESKVPVFDYAYLESALRSKLEGAVPDLEYLGRVGLSEPESRKVELTFTTDQVRTSFLWASKGSALAFLIKHTQNWSAEGESYDYWSIDLATIARPSFDHHTRRPYLHKVAQNAVAQDMFPMDTRLGDPKHKLRISSAGSTTGWSRQSHLRPPVLNAVTYETSLETWGSLWNTKAIICAVRALTEHLQEYLIPGSVFEGRDLPYRVKSVLEQAQEFPNQNGLDPARVAYHFDTNLSANNNQGS